MNTTECINNCIPEFNELISITKRNLRELLQTTDVQSFFFLADKIDNILNRMKELLRQMELTIHDHRAATDEQLRHRVDILHKTYLSLKNNYDDLYDLRT